MDSPILNMSSIGEKGHREVEGPTGGKHQRQCVHMMMIGLNVCRGPAEASAGKGTEEQEMAPNASVALEKDGPPEEGRDLKGIPLVSKVTMRR